MQSLDYFISLLSKLGLGNDYKIELTFLCGLSMQSKINLSIFFIVLQGQKILYSPIGSYTCSTASLQGMKSLIAAVLHPQQLFICPHYGSLEQGTGININCTQYFCMDENY